MDRLFLDANVLFSAAYSATSTMHRLWRLSPAQVVLVVSDLAIAEARRNLDPSKRDALTDLLPDLEYVESPPRHEWRSLVDVSLPDSDLTILQAAIAATATHLLTGDRRHFGPYYGRTIEGVLILPPSNYPIPEPGAREHGGHRS